MKQNPIFYRFFSITVAVIFLLIVIIVDGVCTADGISYAFDLDSYNGHVRPPVTTKHEIPRTNEREVFYIKICMAQMHSLDHSKIDNLDKIDRLSSQAARNGAHIICFPELSIPGYNLKTAQSDSETIPGMSSDRLIQSAVQHRIAILAGMVELDGRRLYITHIAALPDGRLGKYRKIQLGKRERACFSHGEAYPTFDLVDNNGRKVSFGMAVCYDMHFPEIAAELSLKGAQIIFSPHASPFDASKRVAVWNRYMGARAYDNTVFIAACNHITDKGGGGMAVWDYRDASLLVSIENRSEEERRGQLLYCKLNLTKLNKDREKNSKIFYLKDRRKGYGLK